MKPLEQLQDFFNRPLSQKAIAPLKQGCEVAIQIDPQTIFTLTKKKDSLEVCLASPRSPDLSFFTSPALLQELYELSAKDIGEIGVFILKNMVKDSQGEKKITVKVHIGGMALFTKGYLSVLPLGGSAVMKFLASKGLTGLGKIREVVNNIREP